MALCKNLPKQHFLDRRGYPALVVWKRHPPAVLLQVLAGIAHDNRYASELKHLDIVVIVTDGHDLFPHQATMAGPAFESVSLGTALVEHVDDDQVARVVAGLEHGDAVREVCRPQPLFRQLHACDGAAEHGLNGIALERPLD